MRTDITTPTQTHIHLLAEPSLSKIFCGEAKLLYVKKENSSLGQRFKKFILKPVMIVVAKASVLKALKGSAFKDNLEEQRLTNHIKSLGFFEGVSTFKVKDFLVDAALHGSRLVSALNTANNAEKSLAELTGAALKEHVNHPGYMYATLQEYVGTTAKGLIEFHSFHSDPSVQLSEAQKANFDALNETMKALKNGSENSTSIPEEVFIKFFDIYEDFSNRQKAKDLPLAASNLIDRLSEPKSPPTSLAFFLSFFNANPIQYEKSAYLSLATNFINNLEQLTSDLDPYGADKTMRATLNILTKEFMAHIQNPEHPWKTAEEVKALSHNVNSARATS